ncbi:MAG: hypothetical protein ACKOHK_13950, partial [Planctomycetia bacterium]
MTLLIGTDEAGYGPNLGPLVVAATAWRIAGAPEAADATLAAAFAATAATVAARTATRSSRASTSSSSPVRSLPITSTVRATKGK